LVKGFGEDIYELVVGVNMNKVNVPFLIVVSQEVKTDLYVLGFGVKNRVFGYTYGTGAITQQRHSPKLKDIVLQSSNHPKQLGTTSSSSNILNFCGGLGYSGLLARGPRHK
jgi:hypothetical protein